MIETPAMTPKTDPQSSIVVEVHSGSGQAERDLAELRAGLLATPRRISSRFFYDDRGSELFERITELPEYYQTRTEGALLAAVADRIVAASQAEELVEIGSGAATKTRILLDAMAIAGLLKLYVPVDVAEGTVRRVAEELTAEYPGLTVHGVVGDFMTHLDRLPDGCRRLVIFLGGTIGNLLPAQARDFLLQLRRETSPGDFFLLGVDLIKPVERVEAAYNDSAGVTAEFNVNILRAVNALTGGDFDPAAFRHRAFYDRENHWIEMRLVSERAQKVHLPALDLELELAAGEEIHTEISAKYDRPRAESLLRATGFIPVDWYTDPEELFGLALARRA
jgi:L-histidine N-alpha-methyltransferase